MKQPMELAITKDVDAVVPLIGIDKPLRDVALMKEKLESEYNLPVVASGIKATTIAIDKFKTKKFLFENKIKTPKYDKLTRTQYHGSELQIEYPVVLKQPEGQGGVGVQISNSKTDTQKYLKTFPSSMVEEYIKGAEISVEVLRWNQKSVPLVGVYKGDTTLTGTHPIKKTRSAPVNFSDLDNRELLKLAGRIIDKLGACGTSEVEFIYNQENGLYTLEINTRPSGTRFLTYCSSNINPMHQLVNMALGEWHPKKIELEMKNYSALEVSIPPETLRSNPLLRNNDNQKRQILTEEKPYIIHGPEKASRITIRSSHINKSRKIMKNLKLGPFPES